MKNNTRLINVYVIKLLLDADHPQRLRGTLMPVSDGEPQVFSDGPSLISLLDQAVRLAIKNQADGENRIDSECEV